MPDGTRRLRLPGLALLAGLGLAGCMIPIEPGSDLTDPAPQAALGAAVNFQANGEYATTATLDSGVGDPLEAAYTIIATQDGDIPTASATLQMELVDPMMPDVSGPTFSMPVPIELTGEFEGVFAGLMIPKETTGLPQDLVADLSIKGALRSDTCITGDMEMNITEPESFAGLFTPKGPFTAALVDSAGCEGVDTSSMSEQEQE